MRPWLLRSLLFVPANSWRMMTRALGERADAVVLDLEDAVPVDDKETARWLVRELAKDLEGKPEYPKVLVRINSVASGMFREDLEFSIWRGIDGIVVPKVESGVDIAAVEREIARLERERGIRPGTVGIMPLIESAAGIVNLREVAGSSGRIIALSFGAADYLRDMGLGYHQLSDEQTELVYPRSAIAVTARAHGLPAIDSPFMGLIIDMEGLEREARLARSLGFKGKYVIHPRHVEVVNRIFSPSPREVEEARGIVEAYEEARRRGLGVATYAGRMIDEAHYRQAVELLEIARLIEEREGE